MSNHVRGTLRLPYGLNSSSTCTLAAAERAAAVPLRDARAVTLAIERRLSELRAIDERARALVTISPLPFSDV